VLLLASCATPLHEHWLVAGRHDIIAIMAQLLVRDLEDDVVQALRERAAKNGRSVEAEHRALLRAVLRKRSPASFKELLLSIPKAEGDADDAFSFDRGRVRDVDL
jgi:antitoxin FitA